MPIITIDAAWLAANGGVGPYVLSAAGALYQLLTDVATPGTAFRITQNNITLDLNGHTVTYDAATPVLVPNCGFETGDLSGWDVTQAPAASVAPAMLGMYGNWMMNFAGVSASQTFVSSPIAIPQSNIQYLAGIQAKSVAWGTATATLSVVDAVTQAVLGTPQTIDPGGGPILVALFTPVTTNPVVLKVNVAPVAGKTADVCFDYAFCDRNFIFGVDLSYKKASICNGTVTQGRGNSAQSSAICAYGANLTMDGVSVSSSGVSTNVVWCNWGTGVTIRNCSISGRLDRIVNRMAAGATVYAMACKGAISIQNNLLSGTHQNGIVIAGCSDGALTSVNVIGNTIKLDSHWTNGYGIGVGSWVRNFVIAYNTILPVSGRGIILDTNNRVISDGVIYGNLADTVERGDLEYGQLGLIATSLRVRNWAGTIKNTLISGNQFIARTGIGPGIPLQADFAAAGARFGLYNDAGQMTGCNIVVSGNLFKGIQVSVDPALTADRPRPTPAFGLSFPRYDAGMGVKFIGNTCESNNIAVNFGDSDGVGETDIEMIGTTIVKSVDGQEMPFSSLMVGNWGSNVHNVRMIDTVYSNGAPATPTFTSSGAKDISFGSTKINTTYAVPANGNNNAPAITTY